MHFLTWLVERLGGSEQPLICGMCECPVEAREGWRWSRHLSAPVHDLCIPAWVRAAGKQYVELWLETGDSMRELS